MLFDLDGTLVDTAPDLVGAVAHLRAVRGLEPIAAEVLRPHATRGAAGLLEAGFGAVEGIDPDSLREEFLARYASNLWRASRVFDGIDRLLDRLDANGMAMGVVTNKVESLAAPVIRHAGWTGRFGALVGGDTVGRSKPDAAPVVEACCRLAVDPAEVVFLGDDQRDVIAGRAAGTATVVARWGYLPADARPAEWGADALIDHPDEFCALLSDK